MSVQIQPLKVRHHMTSHQTRRIGVRDEYAPTFGRQVLTIWSGGFLSDFDGRAVELPNHNGFMLTIDHLTWTHKVRVDCPSPRTDENFEQVDAAIQAAFTAAEIDTHSTVESEATP